MSPSETAVRRLVVVVLAANAVLLALTELAWLTLRIADVAVPVAALVAAVTTPLLVSAASSAMPRTLAPMVVLGLWVVTVVVIGMWGPAGAGVLPPDGRALLLVAGGLIPGLVAARPLAGAPA